MDNLSAYLPLMAAGFATSAVIGYLAMRWLITYISKNSLLPFAGYCLILGAGSLLLFGFPQIQPAAATNPTGLPASARTDPYRVALEPDLEWLLPAMNICRQEPVDLDILFQQNAVSENSESAEDVYFAYGELEYFSGSVYQIGADEMVLAVNPSNTLQSATQNLAASIFSGDEVTWANAQAACPECFLSTPSETAIQLFIYPKDTNLRGFTLSMLPSGFHFASTATIAPGASQARGAIAADPAAIGFLPRKWLDASVKEILWQDSSSIASEMPILAYTGSRFDKQLAEWLSCVQERIG
jgi:hypothetical protein